MAMVDENGAYAACVTKRIPITSSCEFRNDPSNYSNTTVRFNPKLPGVNDECKGYGISTKIAWKGADWNLGIGGMILNKLGVADEIPVYIDASASDFASPDAIDLITSISVAADVTKIIPTDENGNPFLDDNGEPYFYYECSTISTGLYREEGNKYMCVGDYGYDIAEYPDESFLLPYDEFFSYEKMHKPCSLVVFRSCRQWLTILFWKVILDLEFILRSIILVCLHICYHIHSLRLITAIHL